MFTGGNSWAKTSKLGTFWHPGNDVRRGDLRCQNCWQTSVWGGGAFAGGGKWHGVLICLIVTWLCKPSSSCSSRRTHALLLFPVCACTGTVPWPRLLGWCAVCPLHRHPLLRLVLFVVVVCPGWCFGTGMGGGLGKQLQAIFAAPWGYLRHGVVGARFGRLQCTCSTSFFLVTLFLQLSGPLQRD